MQLGGFQARSLAHSWSSNTFRNAKLVQAFWQADMERRAHAVGLFRVPHLIQLLAFLVRDLVLYAAILDTTFALVQWSQTT